MSHESPIFDYQPFRQKIKKVLKFVLAFVVVGIVVVDVVIAVGFEFTVKSYYGLYIIVDLLVWFVIVVIGLFYINGQYVVPVGVLAAKFLLGPFLAAIGLGFILLVAITGFHNEVTKGRLISSEEVRRDSGTSTIDTYEVSESNPGVIALLMGIPLVIGGSVMFVGAVKTLRADDNENLSSSDDAQTESTK